MKEKTLFGSILNIVRGLLVAFSYFIISYVFSWLISYTHLDLDNVTKRIICYGVVAIVVVLVTVFSKQSFKEYFRLSVKDIGETKPGAIRVAVISAMSLLFGIALNRIITVLVNVIPFPESIVETEEAATTAATSGESLWLVAITTWIVGPIIEELLFRGKAYYYFENVGGRVLAIILSSLTFGIAHGNILQGGYVVIMALFCCVVMRFARNILPAIFLHIGFNASNLILAWLFKNDEETVTLLTVISVIIIVASFAGMYLVYRINAPEKVQEEEESIYLSEEQK